MTGDLLVRHTIRLLSKIKEIASAACSAEPGSGFLSIRQRDITVAADYLRQFGFTPDADSLCLSFQGIRDASLEHGFTDMVAGGEANVDSPQARFGPFPLPHADPDIHAQLQSDRWLAMLGMHAQLANSLGLLINSLNEFLLNAAMSQPRTPTAMAQSKIVTMTKKALRDAIGISDRELLDRLTKHEIIHTSTSKHAKRVTLDAMQFVEPIRSKVLQTVGVDTLADATP